MACTKEEIRMFREMRRSRQQISPKEAEEILEKGKTGSREWQGMMIIPMWCL